MPGADHSGGPWCAAPWTSLYLDPKGEVRACCQNEWHRLGNTNRSSLLEIWQGRPLRRLRTALAAADLRLGCEQCERAAAEGGRAGAYATVFDDLRPVEADPQWPQQLELALTNACNLQCTMCNGELSSAIRIHREGRPALPTVYDDAFFEELDLFLPHLRSLVMLGGEPFLGSESLRVLHRLVELGLTPQCAVTTNATQWSPRIERILRSLPVHVACSIDGATPETFASIRVGAELGPVLENIARYRSALQDGGGSASLSFALQRSNGREFLDVLLLGDRLDLDVFVNLVAHPAAQSIVHAPLEELRSLVADLGARSADAHRHLGRNLRVWDQQLGWLTEVLSGREGSTLGPPPDAEVPVRTPTGAGCWVVESGPDQLVRSVRAPQRRGALALDTLVGRPLWDVVGEVLHAGGELESSVLERLADGERRVLRFQGAGGSLEVVARLVTLADGGERWELQER